MSNMELQLTLERLRDAAELYRQLAKSRRDEADGNRREADLDALDAEYAEDLAGVAEEQSVRRDAAAELEAELQALETRLRERRARKPHDADSQLAIVKDIENLRCRRDKVEQQLLELWQQNASADDAAAAEARNVGDERDRIARNRRDQAERVAKAGRALPEIEADLHHLLRHLSPRIKSRLGRMADRLGDPVADLVTGACGSCGYAMPAQDAVNADREAELVTCQGCGRYIVARSSRKTRAGG